MKKQWSAEELNKRNQIQKNRVRIANMVKRNRPDLIKCYICGSTDAKILHNDDLDNPYMINFICNDCRKNKENIKKVSLNRFDIRSRIGYKNYDVKSKLNESNIKNLVENYLTSNKLIGDYCKDIGTTRYLFNTIIDRYMVIYPNSNIKNKIKDHSYKIKSELKSQKK